MAKGLLINLDRCTGCDSCIVACKLENRLPLGSFYNKVIAIGPTGTFPDVEKYWLPSQCQQCENPQCVAVCPTGASYRDPETGYVLIDKDKCIGCQYCLYGCPYGVRQMDEEHGVAQKCTLCSQITAVAAMCPPAYTIATAAPVSLAITTIPTATFAGKWRSTPKSAFTLFPTPATPSRSPATSCPRSSPVGRS